MSELKPCPFCGSEAKTKHYEDNSSLIIYCPTCSKDWDLAGESPGERWAADFEFVGWSEEDDDAVIAAWNRRAIDRDELLEVAESLEKPWPDDKWYPDTLLREEVQLFEGEMAQLIRKAVGA